MLDDVTSDHAFVTELVHGAVRRREILEWIIRQCTPTPPPPVVQAVLWVGVEQLCFMDHVEPYAAVHETVEAARQLGVGWATKLVNAVLRRVQRERSEWLLRLRRAPPALRYSHPIGLLERWEREFGQTRAHRLCEWNNLPPDTCLRLRPTGPSMQEFLERLDRVGCPAHPHPFDPARFVILGHGVPPAKVPGYEQGWFYVQDPSTALAPDMLHPRPGEVAVDLCAAPGGKTAMLAEAVARHGIVIACDRHADRLQRLCDNVQRLGLSNVRICELDATRVSLEQIRAELPDPALTPTAVLLDVPCTNTGVIRRRPDVRWAFSPARLSRAIDLQRQLLQRAAELLDVGGRLVYSTCSLEREENREMVRAFLEEHPDFELIGERLLFPPDSATDGAYAALLVRRPPRR